MGHYFGFLSNNMLATATLANDRNFRRLINVKRVSKGILKKRVQQKYGDGGDQTPCLCMQRERNTI